MPRAANGEIELEYETFGNSDDPALICIPGLGNQMLLYPEEFCQAFVDRGFLVIRMDNRDAGLSSLTDESDVYTLTDMANDVAAVLDHAGVGEAVVLGMSLGGMISQAFAIAHPSRTRALVSIGSTTGESDVGAPTADAIAAITSPASSSVAEQIEADLVARKIWSNPDWFDEEQMRAYFTELYERSWTPGASARQYGAVVRSGDRAEGLAALDVAALVVHGENDTLINISGGRRTAELIPGAEFLEIDGMSHDFVSQMWPPVIEAVTSLASRTFR